MRMSHLACTLKLRLVCIPVCIAGYGTKWISLLKWLRTILSIEHHIELFYLVKSSRFDHGQKKNYIFYRLRFATSSTQQIQYYTDRVSRSTHGSSSSPELSSTMDKCSVPLLLLVNKPLVVKWDKISAILWMRLSFLSSITTITILSVISKGILFSKYYSRYNCYKI